MGEFKRNMGHFFSGIRILVSLIIGLIGPLALAQDQIQVTATVDRNHMRPGDTFTYTISISGGGGFQAEAPVPPDFKAFEEVRNWVQSEESATFVNGQVIPKRAQHFKYLMAATQVGKFNLGAAEVQVNGKVYRSNPISVEVSENVPEEAQSRQRQRVRPDPMDDPSGAVWDDEDDLFSQLLRRRFNQRRGGSPNSGALNFGQRPVDPSEAFFIHVEVDKNKVFQGEPVVVSWYLVTRSQISDIDTLKYPALTGFWKEDIEVATRLNFQPEIINGVPYQRARLASYALFAIKPGLTKIDPYQAKCRVINFNNFGLPQESFVTKQSEEIQIDVLPLPLDGKKSDFTGGVGEYTVSARLDAARVKKNTPFTLQIRVEGRGNAKLIDLPQLKLPDGLQLYDTKSDMKYFPNGSSFKNFEVLIVPRKEGAIQIPAMELQFFSPEKKSYYSQLTPELTIQVDPGDASSIIESERMQKGKGPESPQSTLPPLLLDAGASESRRDGLWLSLWAGLYFVSSLILGLYGYWLLRPKTKKENLQKIIRRKMVDIQAAVSSNDWRKIGVDGSNLIYFVLGEVAGRGVVASDFAHLMESAPPSFRRQLATPFKNLMSQLEILGFAPENVVGSRKESGALKKVTLELEQCLILASAYDFRNSGGAE